MNLPNESQTTGTPWPPNDGTRTAKLAELNTLAHNNFEDAELIFGLDEETGNRFLVFGGETLKEVTEAHKSRECSVMEVSILQRTSELEALVGGGQNCPGSYCDYADRTQSVREVLERRRDDFNRLVQG